MQIIGNLFNIILFVTVVGGAFTLLSLLANRVFRFALPLWFGICGIFAYIIPLPTPGLRLIPPEKQSWINGYYIACVVWVCGIVILSVIDVVRSTLAHHAIRSYRVCTDERINGICIHCGQLIGIKKNPSIYFGTLDDPACVVGTLRPAIILNEVIIKQLTDIELTTVLSHEITHMKRRHIILERIFHYVCIINWFNLLSWIAKKNFAVHCEVDCDRHTLKLLHGRITDVDYASAMLRLLELSMVHTPKAGYGMSALGFLLAKRRMKLIMSRLTKTKSIIITIILAVLLTAAILFSMMLSRGHFYPYPAYDTLPEYSYSERQKYFPFTKQKMHTDACVRRKANDIMSFTICGRIVFF